MFLVKKYSNWPTKKFTTCLPVGWEIQNLKPVDLQIQNFKPVDQETHIGNLSTCRPRNTKFQTYRPVDREIQISNLSTSPPRNTKFKTCRSVDREMQNFKPIDQEIHIWNLSTERYKFKICRPVDVKEMIARPRCTTVRIYSWEKSCKCGSNTLNLLVPSCNAHIENFAFDSHNKIRICCLARSGSLAAAAIKYYV
jgi:hypothetical protein